LKKEGKCPEHTVHRQVKYLNNGLEADHGKLKQLIRPVRGFKTLKTAYATIKGFEVMRALRKGQARAFNITRGIRGEARLAERAFGLGASPLAEAIQFISGRLEVMQSDQIARLSIVRRASTPAICNRDPRTFSLPTPSFTVTSIPADINSQPLTTATSGRRPSMSGAGKRAPKTQRDRLVTMIFAVTPSALG
jgi:DDE domain